MKSTFLMPNKQIKFVFASLFLLFFACNVATAGEKKEEVSKTISEKYSADKDTKLRILNRYGKVHINTSAKNEITVDIVLKAYGRSKEKAQDLLDNIEIKYGKAGNLISYETIINSKKSSWFDWDWSSWMGSDDERGFEINYTVNMPMENALDLENKYGAVFLDNFNGVLNLTVKYGSLKANAIKGENKNIELAYSKGSIETLEFGNLTCRYGSGSIEEAGEISLENKYSSFKINKARKIQTDTKYGSLEVQQTDYLNGTVGYSSCEVGELRKKMNMEVRYAGKFSVDKVAEGFESIEIDGSYNNVKFGFAPKANFDYSVETKYGHFKNMMSNINITKEREDNSEEYHEGSVNGGKGGKITINLKYGGAKFIAN